MNESTIKELAERFICWPLPKSVCSDECCSMPDYPHERIGTNLLTVVEAEQMMREVVAPLIDGATKQPQGADWAGSAPLVWRSNKFLREAFVETIRGLREKLSTISYTLFDKPQQSSAHLCWMLNELERRLDEFPVDKTGRWIGYIQGCLACNGLLDVDQERDRTRPLFQKVYGIANASLRPLVANREDSEAKRAYEQWYLELIEEIYRDFPDGMNERPDPRVLVKMWREWYSGTESRAAWAHKVLCYESDVKQLRAQLSAVISLLVSYAPASHEGTARLVLESQALIDRTPTAAMRPAQPERGQGEGT